MVSAETYTYSELQLIVSDYPTLNEPETIAAGAGVVVAGTVLGKITATGKWIPSLSAASDGSEVPRGVLGVGLDASASDVVGPVFKAGVFNPSAMTFGAGHDAVSVKSAWEGMPLFVRQPLNDGSV